LWPFREEAVSQEAISPESKEKGQRGTVARKHIHKREGEGRYRAARLSKLYSFGEVLGYLKEGAEKGKLGLCRKQKGGTAAEKRKNCALFEGGTPKKSWKSAEREFAPHERKRKKMKKEIRWRIA